VEIQARFPCEVRAVRYARARNGDVELIPTKLKVVHKTLDITIGPVVESKHKGIARCLVSIRNPWQCDSLPSIQEVIEWVSVNAQ
jgi:hypothetical protein